MKRSVLFGAWATVALAASVWACSSSTTPGGTPDGMDASGGSDATMPPMDDGGGNPGDSGGNPGDSGGSMDTGGGDAGEAICATTTTHQDCVDCCATFHPTGANTIPVAAHTCACQPGPSECANPCNTTYCQPDGAVSAPDAGSSCDQCLNKAFAGDAGFGRRTPHDCLDAAISACDMSTDCKAYYACRANSMCKTKP